MTHLFLQTSRLNFKPTIGKIFEYFIESTLVDIRIPIEEMSRSDKKSFVKQVNENGVFLISGAVDRISATLEVSKQTIYNYLDEAQG
jgi:predicted transcriptional regulator YheO